MSVKMGTITQSAFEKIDNDRLLMQKYASVESVLDYLQDEANFKSLSTQLQETMVNAGVCEKGKPVNVFVDILHRLLSNQDISCGRTKTRHKNTIRRWFSGKSQVRHIRNRSDLIEICFALELSLDQANELMNKCGHMGLNIRDAEDAVYYYCFLNHRPYPAALELYKKYVSAEPAQAFEQIPSDETVPHTQDTGDTTLFLQRQLTDGSSWKNDEAFLNTFLIPNKNHFISYSKTAVHEYNKMKNPVYLYALKRWLKEEEQAFEARKKEEYIHRIKKDDPVTIGMSDVQVTYNFINNLKKYSGENPILNEASKMLHVQVARTGSKTASGKRKPEVDNSCMETLDFIRFQTALHADDPEIQSGISGFLSSTLTAYRMFYIWIPVLARDGEDTTIDRRQRPYRKSFFKDSIMFGFPHRQVFTRIENSPEKLIHDLSLRKTLILLFYLRYAYDWIIKLDDPSFSWGEAELDFEDFMVKMNAILNRCQMAPLYPANQFDWLILRSIREFEISDYYEDKETPLAFFNDVLAYSFGDDVEDV